jgi:hypothetical protein
MFHIAEVGRLHVDRFSEAAETIPGLETALSKVCSKGVMGDHRLLLYDCYITYITIGPRR